VGAQEARLLDVADRVFASSPLLGERLRVRRPDTEVMPNVADVGLFARALRNPGPPPEALSGVPRPRAVYMGNISTYKVDMPLLAGLVRTLPWLQLVLVGEVGLGDTADARAALRALRERGNVHVLPPRAPEALPPLLAACDVALIPFVSNGHTRSSLPLKLWEYLAAGLPVVATDLPNLRGLGPEWAIRLSDGPRSFASHVEKALQEPGGRSEERLALARGHDWDTRIETILERLAEPGLRR
jgi:glycosyltransferase involved in cell wall biosynthesis